MICSVIKVFIGKEALISVSKNFIRLLWFYDLSKINLATYIQISEYASVALLDASYKPNKSYINLLDTISSSFSFKCYLSFMEIDLCIATSSAVKDSLVLLRFILWLFTGIACNDSCLITLGSCFSSFLICFEMLRISFYRNSYWSMVSSFVILSLGNIIEYIEVLLLFFWFGPM